MDKAEFMELRNKLQQFEEEHGSELSCENETKSLMSMISICTDYIMNMEEGLNDHAKRTQ